MQRHIMRIELTGPAKQKLSSLSDRHGMTQVAMMSRLVEWFAAQDEPIQSAVESRFSTQTHADVAKMILKKMAGT